MKLQEDFKTLERSNASITNKVQEIDQYVQTLPTAEDLQNHGQAMDEALGKIQEVSTGLTVHMEQYKIFESTTHGPGSIQAGPSYPHPDRQPQVENYDDYQSSLSTQEDARQCYGLRGGHGSESEEDDPNVAEDSTPQPGPSGPVVRPRAGPPPLGPLAPPSGRSRHRAEVKPIELKDPYPFEGKPGEDFDA